MTRILTVDDYFHHGRSGVTAQIDAQARAWLSTVNQLLLEAHKAGIDLPNDQLTGTPIASGYRPPEVNARTANAGKSSTHLRGQGGDLQDWRDRRFAVWLVTNQRMLVEHGLWMEDPRWTAGKTRSDPWVHVQIVPPASGRRIYVPSTAPAQDPDFYKLAGVQMP